MLQKARPLMAVKAVNDKKGFIEGYASLYGVEDSDGDVVEAARLTSASSNGKAKVAHLNNSRIGMRNLFRICMN